MSLPEIRFQFRVSLSDPERGVDVQQKVLNLSLHPSETLERLYLRLLAWAIFWSPGLVFGPGLSDPDAPALEERDLDGRRTTFLTIDPPTVEKLAFAVRHNKGARVGAIFGSAGAVRRFLDSDPTPHGIDTVEFVRVDERFLEQLAACDERRYDVSITIVEDALYVDLTGARQQHPGAWQPSSDPTRSFSGIFSRGRGIGSFSTGAAKPMW